MYPLVKGPLVNTKLETVLLIWLLQEKISETDRCVIDMLLARQKK